VKFKTNKLQQDGINKMLKLCLILNSKTGAKQKAGITQTNLPMFAINSGHS